MKGNISLRAVLVSALAILGLAAGTARAVVMVTTSTTTQTFDTAPAATEWSTYTIGGAAGDITTAADMNTRVQLLTSATISTALPTNAGAPGTNALARWNIPGQFLETAATGGAAVVLMATLQNNTGGEVSMLDVGYAFGATNTPGGESVPGHQVYYSLTGLANSWTQISAFSSQPVGSLSTSLNLGAWASGDKLYMLWADDNAATNPDGIYTIDNLSLLGTLSVITYDATWTGASVTTPTLWSDGTNWDPAGVPGGAGKSVAFGSIPGKGSVVLDLDRTVGTIGFDVTQPTTIGGTNRLTLNNGGSAARLQVNGAAAHEIATPVTLVNGVNVTVSDAGGALTLSGAMEGVGGLIKAGPGLLTLGAANTYSGVTKVIAGTLKLTNALALQNSVFDTTGAGVLDVTGYPTPTLGGLQGSVSLSTAIIAGYDSVSELKLNPQSGATASYSGAIADGAVGMKLTKTGAGTQILSGANTYGGGTTISGGVLQFAKLVSMPASGNVAVDTGSTLSVKVGGTGEWTTGTSGNGTIGGLLAGVGGLAGSTVSYSGNVTLALDNATDQTYAGAINDVGTSLTLAKSGAGTLTLSGTNTFSGGTVVNAGALSVSATANLGSGGITFNGSATIWTSGWLSGASWPIALNNGAIATFTTGGWDFQFYTTEAVTGNGGVLVYGGGDAGAPWLKLGSTTNTFTGPIYIGISSRNGLVYVNSLADSDSPIQFGYGTAANGFRTGCYLVYGTGATADLVLNQRYFVVSAANSANGILNDSSKALTVNTDLRVTGTGSMNFSLGGTGAGLSTFAGKITDGPGAVVRLTKAESGTWVLSGANTYSGGTTVSGGTLKANGAGALGAGFVTVSSGTLIIDAADAMADTATLYLPSATTKNLTMNADDIIGSLFLGGIQQPNGIYTSSGLGSAWMYTGIGKLIVGSLATLPVYWDLNGNTAGACVSGNTADGTWNATNTYWNAAAAGTDATMAWTGGTATFAAGTDANSSYTVTVEGTRDIGGLTFEEGSVTLSPGTAGGLRMTANSLLSVATGLTATVATPISQDATARSLTKAGAGTLVLSVNNTYTGATTITSGTLLVASLASAGSDSPIGNYPTAGAAGLSLNGGTLQYTGGSVTSDRGFTLAATSTVDLAAGTALTLGDCSMGAYTLNVTGGSGSSLGLGAVTLTGAATLNPTTASLTVASVAATNQNLTLGGTATGSAVTGGIATGSGTVTKNGTGTWTLSGTNTWTGQTTISAGTLVFAGASTLPPAAAQIGVGNGGTLRLQQDGGGVTVNNLCNSGGRGIVATYEADRQTPGSGDGLNYVFTKTCYNIDTGSTLNVQAGPNITSGTPTVDFSNASGSRGLMCWDSDIGNAAVVATGVNLRINGITGGNLKVLTLSGTSAGSEVYGVMDFGASVAGGLTKAGTGTWTLSGVNTYTGPTTVNSGTLALSGTGDVNSSSGITLNGPTAVFMQNSSVANSRTFTLTQGTLGGTGTISTAITSGASVTIAPGDRTLASPAAGTLTIANDVNLTDGTTTEMRLFSTAANDSDKLWQTTTGGLGYGGILKIIAVNSLAFAVGNNWDLFDFDSQSGLFSNDSEFGTVGGTYLPLLTADKKWSFAYTTGVLSVVSGLFPGDTNGDFVVDAADYIAIKTNFGLSGLGITRLQGDLIDNDVVDWADLQELMNAMATRTVPGAPAAPEPATLGLLAIGALAVLRRRRRS